jgi:SAM-dependent methyltransferase
MHRPAPYDPIATLYDRHWGHDFAALSQQAIETHLSPRLPRNARVLDLCCGTGLLLAHLETLGYQAFGVDESANMLELARRHAPRASLQQADMAQFHWAHPFDAVLSFYNSLNHADSPEHLRKTLVNIADHLRPSGLLLFDYVLPEAFETAWDCTEHASTGARTWSLHYCYERASGHATCVIDQRQTIRQRAFSVSEIHHALLAANLAVVSDEPMAGALPAGGRRLLLARKT